MGSTILLEPYAYAKINIYVIIGDVVAFLNIHKLRGNRGLGFILMFIGNFHHNGELLEL